MRAQYHVAVQGSGGAHSAGSSSQYRPGGLVAFVVGIGFTGGFIGGLKYAETDAFCRSCHDMNTPFQEYKWSVHYSNVFGIQASTDVWGHLTGELDAPAEYESHRLTLAQKIWAELKANDSAECRSCHTSAVMAFAKQPPVAARTHESMAKSAKTCIDCHKGVAHTLPAGS
jgi:nitrate/TMAO reductase-like tetraheme cytochrome c subunit